MYDRYTRGALALASLILIGSLASPAFADVVDITVDTSALNGTAAQLAFDFVAGGPPENSITITGFSTDGTLGSQSSTGSVTGTLPGDVTLSDTSFFNELLANITLGNSFSFQVDSTNLAPTGAFPDEFSLFVLDTMGNPLMTSSDPTGADSLVTIDLTGGPSSTVTAYTSSVSLAPPATSAVPEPSTLIPMAVAAGLILLTRRVRARRSIRGAAVAAAFLGSLSAQTNITTPVTDDTNISVSLSGLRLNRTTKTYDSVVTVTNTSAQPINGPFYLAVHGIDQSSVTFANSVGLLPNQLSYIPLSVGTQLAPNQPTVGGVLKFNNPENVVFHVSTGVWDAASVPQLTAALSCPSISVVSDPPVYANYTLPVDNVGRTATCTPPPGTYLPSADNWVQCNTSGGNAAPAACAFDYHVSPQTIPIDVIQLGQTLVFGADMALTPCSAFLAAQAENAIGAASTPAGMTPITINVACYGPAPGTATFNIVNNGPYTAYNVQLALGVPSQYPKYAMQFSQGGTCSKASTPVLPNGDTYPGGDVVNCYFTSIAAGETIVATVGVDQAPGSDGNNAIPSLFAQVADDPNFNADPNLGNNSIAFKVNMATFQPIPIPPLPGAQCQDDPGYPSFEMLIDTCGVPPLVVDIVTGAILGGATVIMGGGAVLLDTTDIGLSTIFNAAQPIGFIR